MLHVIVASLERYLRPEEHDQQQLDLERNITRASMTTQRESDTQEIPRSEMMRCKHKERMLRFRYNLWLFWKHITKYEYKFALKMAVAVTALCTPAFVPWTAVWFAQDRAQWAAVTVSDTFKECLGILCFTCYVGGSHHESHKVSC